MGGLTLEVASWLEAVGDDGSAANSRLQNSSKPPSTLVVQNGIMSQAMASWQVYMVRCADDSLYTGCTNDLHRRIEVHNAGRGARYTRSRRPVELVWSVRVKDKSAALSREAKLKQLTRAQKWVLVKKRRPA